MSQSNETAEMERKKDQSLEQLGRFEFAPRAQCAFPQRSGARNISTRVWGWRESPKAEMVARLRTWNGVSRDLLCESHLPFAAREERGGLENVRATLGDQRQFGAEHFFVG